MDVLFRKRGPLADEPQSKQQRPRREETSAFPCGEPGQGLDSEKRSTHETLLISGLTFVSFLSPLHGERDTDPSLAKSLTWITRIVRQRGTSQRQHSSPLLIAKECMLSAGPGAARIEPFTRPRFSHETHRTPAQNQVLPPQIREKRSMPHSAKRHVGKPISAVHFHRRARDHTCELPPSQPGPSLPVPVQRQGLTTEAMIGQELTLLSPPPSHLENTPGQTAPDGIGGTEQDGR
ncbi:predicted protein [Chaetomium globosum CBS 148.51]|uniref:Uncharacterized protein n=1 Tax=Chaetomium globosum (strain ATCC 6205 / CBS 148.51 / DSM 1962 / NBRC 6347 / NRRL 1970) TaxID=306901 RepID=Q2HB87_CHAGB|nr:uncharacterized protein CHGG_02517 [Chaetomium globosum CBS 148.51]EAQ90582.1 predicted protein [Chaetomium globosum CBS 148.51]